MSIWVLVYLAALLLLGSSSAFKHVERGSPVWLAAWDIVSTAALVYLVALYFNPQAVAPRAEWLWALVVGVVISEAACVWRARSYVEEQLATVAPEDRRIVLGMAQVLVALYYVPAAALVFLALRTRS